MSDFALIRRLASDDDFYIAEAIGDAIVQRPRARALAAIAAAN